jgi:hypothetical protein
LLTDGIAELCERIDPIKQFEMLREITQPGLLNDETEEEAVMPASDNSQHRI